MPSLSLSLFSFGSRGKESSESLMVSLSVSGLLGFVPFSNSSRSVKSSPSVSINNGLLPNEISTISGNPSLSSSGSILSMIPSLSVSVLSIEHPLESTSFPVGVSGHWSIESTIPSPSLSKNKVTDVDEGN